jgi:transposase
VNQFFNDHPGFEVAFEHLNVAGMKFKARTMNAYLYASNLAHIPKHLAWVAAKRGQKATRVKSAYSSQECNACHYTDSECKDKAQIKALLLDRHHAWRRKNGYP